MEYLGENHWYYFKKKSNGINNWKDSEEAPILCLKQHKDKTKFLKSG